MEKSASSTDLIVNKNVLINLEVDNLIMKQKLAILEDHLKKKQSDTKLCSSCFAKKQNIASTTSEAYNELSTCDFKYMIEISDKQNNKSGENPIVLEKDPGLTNILNEGPSRDIDAESKFNKINDDNDLETFLIPRNIETEKEFD
ncbi:MAG: hypothetical protein Hyperionvirus29_13 [Hyperionvirus sp.]|uniref:Uncharacterized protein n=1 Tax=Hyperionvirus sp. TaxID=2487770 RepID=A0A3G5ABI8_9VIRU|nr:MAG: hypothetical protein Hyperionvirus29_13 [Hyperionvirus sp.]